MASCRAALNPCASEGLNDGEVVGSSGWDRHKHGGRYDAVSKHYPSQSSIIPVLTLSGELPYGSCVPHPGQLSPRSHISRILSYLW